MALLYASLYEIAVGDDLGSPDTWNVRFESIDVRLNAVEGFTNTANDASTQIINDGIERINTVLQPLLDTLTTNVNALSSQVSTLSGQVLSDQDSLTSQLASFITEAQGLLNNLENLGEIDGGTF